MFKHRLEVLMDLVNTQKVVFLDLINFVESKLIVFAWQLEISIFRKFLWIEVRIKFYKPVKVSQKTDFVRFLELILNVFYELGDKRFLKTNQEIFDSIEISYYVHLLRVKLLPFILMKLINIPNILFLQKRHINIRHVCNDVRNVILLWSKCFEHWVDSLKNLLRIRVLQFVIKKVVENPFWLFLKFFFSFSSLWVQIL